VVVGQVVNLRRVGNPPQPPLSKAAGPISNRPQVANLPHHLQKKGEPEGSPVFQTDPGEF
jgi:hypothetical protein